MKKSVVLLVVALFMNVAFVSAKELNEKRNYIQTNQEFAKFLSPNGTDGELEKDVVVTVKVLITDNHEILVVQTNTNNSTIANYIKESLNYKKLSSEELEVGKSYVFKVNFKA